MQRPDQFVQGRDRGGKASRDLGILPASYPVPPVHAKASSQQVNATSTQVDVSAETLIAEFPTVFDGQVKCMPGESFRITLREDSKPFCVSTPRRIPLPYREKLKEQLDKLLAANIIAPVTEPTDWCAPIVVAPKKNTDEIGLCVDFTKLNKFVRREIYQSSTPAEAVAEISATEAKFFTTFDALKGYHQCPLDEESQLLTTFITPFGRYKYLRALYGICSISEHYNRRMDEAMAGLTQYSKVVDDVCVFDRSFADHVAHVRQFLQRCADRGISLNRDKFRFGQEEVLFAGYVLSSLGYSPDPKLLSAITDFPTPESVTDLRSFLGMVTQLSAFCSDIADCTHPLRGLLSTKNEFIWTADHNAAFAATKQALVAPQALAYYDPSHPTRLHTDASRRQGLGFVLTQKQPDNTWCTVQAGSRFLSGTESRYAVIELELLGVAWAVTKCSLFLAGLPHFDVIIDHKPLVPILNNHRLDEIENIRLQRLRTKLMPYNFTATWLKGSDNAAADALSRAPVAPADHEDILEEDVAICTIALANLASENSNLRLDDLCRNAADDPGYQSLLSFVTNGFPEHKSDLPEVTRQYWHIRSGLTVDDGIVLYGTRLVIPPSMRRKMLVMLHEGHQGIERTKQRARGIVYWPGIDNDIDNTVRSCADCQRELPSLPKEPYIRHASPTQPFQVISADLATHAGQQFLVVVDHLSNWPFVFQLGTTSTARQLIHSFRQVFCFAGAPDVLYSDNGPQFNAYPLKSFLADWGVEHRTSSPHYPQSNGHAEAAVKSMKRLLRRCWCDGHLDDERWTAAILQYRNTPGSDGESPAEILFGHPVQDKLPAHRRAFAHRWQSLAEHADAASKHADHQVQAEARYNASAATLPDLRVGTQVAIQNPSTKLWDRYGVIIQLGSYRRYFVRLPSGRILTRNCRFIRRRFGFSVHVPVTPASGSPTGNTPSPTEPASSPVAPAPRRSVRSRRKPDRLIETM